MKFPIKKAKKNVIVTSKEGNVIVYNSVLNNPLFFEPEAFEFYNNFDEISEKEYCGFDDDTRAVIDSMTEQYLFLDDGVDEYDICSDVNRQYMEKVADGKTICWLDLHVSDACNFGCPHCIAGNEKQNYIMTYEECKDILDKYMCFIEKHNTELKELNIHFGSCEPLINYQVIKEIVKYVKSTYAEYSLNLTLNTNLTLITTEMAVFFRDNNIEVCTSLDGLKEYNDRIRVYPDGRGTFDDIIESMRIMEKVGTPVDGISITLTDKNYKGINEFLEWCINAKMKSIAIDFDLIHSTEVTTEEKASFILKTYRRLKEENIEFHGTWMTPFLNICNSSNANESVTFCRSAAGENCSVDKNGNMRVCSYSKEIIGSIDRIEVDIKPNGRYNKFIMSHLVGNMENNNCGRCPLEGSCIGQCAISRKDLCHKDFDEQCQYFRLVTRYLLESMADEMARE